MPACDARSKLAIKTITVLTISDRFTFPQSGRARSDALSCGYTSL